MELTDTKKIIEAILFVAAKPLTFAQIASFLERQIPAEERPGMREKIREALLGLEEDLKQGRGIVLSHVAGGYQLRTDPTVGPWLQKFLAARPERLSKSALETLSMIAYKQPLTRAEIEHLRGVDCSGVLATLLEKNLIKIAGKKEVPGRPLLYGTTKEFLELFGLNDLSDLPTLRQIEELMPKEGAEGEGTEIAEGAVPDADAPPDASTGLA